MKMGVIKGENFDLNELKIKEAEGTTFMKVPFIYEGTTPVIEIVGEVRLYKNWFDGRKSYSVGIKVDDHGPSELGVPRRAEEGLKSRQISHADISITGSLLLWNPRI